MKPREEGLSKNIKPNETQTPINSSREILIRHDKYPLITAKLSINRLRNKLKA
jgi:hypothetical protein